MMRCGTAAAAAGRENRGRALEARAPAEQPRNDLRDISGKYIDMVLLWEAYELTEAVTYGAKFYSK
jgi:hypothetical protein